MGLLGGIDIFYPGFLKILSRQGLATNPPPVAHSQFVIDTEDYQNGQSHRRAANEKHHTRLEESGLHVVFALPSLVQSTLEITKGEQRYDHDG